MHYGSQDFGKVAITCKELGSCGRQGELSFTFQGIRFCMASSMVENSIVVFVFCESTPELFKTWTIEPQTPLADSNVIKSAFNTSLCFTIRQQEVGLNNFTGPEAIALQPCVGSTTISGKTQSWLFSGSNLQDFDLRVGGNPLFCV